MSFTIERSSINSKSREKIIALLSQDNTLSATALAKRIGIPPKKPWKNRLPGWKRTGYSDESDRTKADIGRWSKKRIDFSGGSAVCRLPASFGCQKNIPPIGYRNSIRTGSILLTVCCFSFVFLFRLFRRSLVSAADSVHCTDVKGKKFSGWIRSEGGRFSPKRPAARLFHFQWSLY